MRRGLRERRGGLQAIWARTVGRSRVGLIVARGPCLSVERNRVRRVLREAFRGAIVKGSLPCEGVDVILRISTAEGIGFGREMGDFAEDILVSVGRKLRG
ncbi:MAG: hypothetical protein CME06_09050 [Gemmatimonadetes bacterium]|nr:hypothetical protein [Gemmatimonadota bacterium]